MKLDTHLLESDRESSVSGDADQDRFLDEINQNIEKEEATGPAVHERMVVNVGKAWQTVHEKRDRESKFDDIAKKFPQPENTKFTVIPKVNPKIWSVLPEKEPKMDAWMQRMQACSKQ